MNLLRALAVAGFILIAGSSQAEESDVLKLTFVCKEGDCQYAFEEDVDDYLGCGDVLIDAASPSQEWRWPVGGKANLVVSYATAMADQSTEPLVKSAETYDVKHLYHTSATGASDCLRLDRYDDGKRAVSVLLLQIGQYKGLSDSAKQCLALARKDLPRNIAWCHHRRVGGGRTTE